MGNGEGKDNDFKEIIGQVSLLDKDVIKFSTIFLYPFYYQGDKEAIIRNLTSSGRWGIQLYDYQEHYDEYVYFHPFTRSILFDQNKDDHRKAMTYLRFKGNKKLKLRITYKKDEEPVSYTIDSIQIHLFDLAIGILTIQIESNEKIEFKKILKFNERVRRIASSWKGQKEDGYLPQRMKFIDTNGNSIGESVESFDEQEMVQLPPDGVVYVSKLIQYLMAPLKNEKVDFSEKGKIKLKYQTVLDERMVVYSYACFDERVKAEEIILADEDFLAFALVDEKFGGSFANKGLIDEYLSRHEYAIWKDYGTRYGFSRYSGVVMGVGNFFKDKIFRHFETIYYEIALILYFHRAALLRFSRESALCAEILSRTKDSIRQEDLDRVTELRKNFLIFTNKFWFTEITNQDQGIAMFDQWEGILRNKELFEEVAYELKEINEFIERRESTRLEQRVATLTIITIVFLPIIVLTSFLGMNTFSDISKWWIFIAFVPALWLLAFVLVQSKKIMEWVDKALTPIEGGFIDRTKRAFSLSWNLLKILFKGDKATR